MKFLSRALITATITILGCASNDSPTPSHTLEQKACKVDSLTALRLIRDIDSNTRYTLVEYLNLKRKLKEAEPTGLFAIDPSTYSNMYNANITKVEEEITKKEAFLAKSYKSLDSLSNCEKPYNYEKVRNKLNEEAERLKILNKLTSEARHLMSQDIAKLEHKVVTFNKLETSNIDSSVNLKKNHQYEDRNINLKVATLYSPIRVNNLLETEKEGPILEVEVTPIRKGKIVDSRTHDYRLINEITGDTAAFPIGFTLKDNFNNTYRISYITPKNIRMYPGKSHTVKVVFQDPIVEDATNLNLVISRNTFSSEASISMKIPINRVGTKHYKSIEYNLYK
jgi:hypothetical protein